MMKEQLIEYYHNGRIKHRICYYFNGNKWLEYYYDEDGKSHRENLPDYQEWYNNGRLYRKTYCYHGENHNINNPTDISFSEDGKILWKYYHLKERWLFYTKLDWQNLIKNI